LYVCVCVCVSKYSITTCTYNRASECLISSSFMMTQFSSCSTSPSSSWWHIS
jgi:hypothetical protein